jgi:hypothetical protein
MTAPLINGKSYGWSDIQVVIMGRIVAGITAISYEDTQMMKDNPGAGKYPTSRGYGGIEAKASITLEMKELLGIQAAGKAAGYSRIQEIPKFNIPVAYVDSENVPVTDMLFNVQFTGNKRDVKTGDGSIEVQLDLIVSHIGWGV